MFKVKMQDLGRSMVEMLGVLAIIGVLSVAGIAGYRYAMDRYIANDVLHESNIRGFDVTANFKGRRLPDIAEIGGYAKYTGTGKPIGVYPNPEDFSWSEYADKCPSEDLCQAFDVEVKGLNKRQCQMIMQSSWELPDAYLVSTGIAGDTSGDGTAPIASVSSSRPIMRTASNADSGLCDEFGEDEQNIAIRFRFVSTFTDFTDEDYESGWEDETTSDDTDGTGGGTGDGTGGTTGAGGTPTPEDPVVPETPTCTGNSYLSGTSCVECGTNQQINSTSNGCECKQDYYPAGSCTTKCESPRSWLDGTCKCANGNWNGTSCVTCGPNEVWTGSDCVCDDSSYNSGDSCIQCPAQSTVNSGKNGCICTESNAYWNGNSCVSCGTNQQVNETQNGCECKTNWHGERCATYCDTSVASMSSGTCACKDTTTYWNGQACESCGANKVYENGSCVCNNQSYADGDSCIQCPSGSTPISGGCDCDGDGNWNGSSCITCNTNATFTDNECVCNDGYSGDGQTCVVCESPRQTTAGNTGCECPGGMEYIESTNKCYDSDGGYTENYCDAGEIWNGSECVPNSCTTTADCPGTYYCDIASSTCIKDPACTDTNTILDITKEKCDKCEDRFYVEASGYCTHCNNQTTIENTTQAECEVCANRIWTSDGICTVCPTGQVRLNTGYCGCVDGFVWDTTTLTCMDVVTYCTNVMKNAGFESGFMVEGTIITYTGNMTITDTVNLSPCTLEVSGQIIIEDGGTLSVDDIIVDNGNNDSPAISIEDGGTLIVPDIYYCKEISNQGTINGNLHCVSGCECDCSADNTICMGDTPYCTSGICSKCPIETPHYNETSGCQTCETANTTLPYWNGETHQCENCPETTPLWDSTTKECIKQPCETTDDCLDTYYCDMNAKVCEKFVCSAADVLYDMIESECEVCENRFWSVLMGYCVSCDNPIDISPTTKADCEECTNRYWTSQAEGADSGVCSMCPKGQYRDSMGICACPSNLVWDTTTLTCTDVETFCINGMKAAGFDEENYAVSGDVITYTGNMRIAQDLPLSACYLKVDGELTVNEGVILSTNILHVNSPDNVAIFVIGELTATDIYYCKEIENNGQINGTLHCAEGCNCDCSADETLCTGETHYCTVDVCSRCPFETPVWNETIGLCETCPDNTVWNGESCVSEETFCAQRMQMLGYNSDDFTVEDDTITYDGDMIVLRHLDMYACNLNVTGMVDMSENGAINVKNLTVRSDEEYGILVRGSIHVLENVNIVADKYGVYVLDSAIMTVDGDISAYGNDTGIYVDMGGTLNARNIHGTGGQGVYSYYGKVVSSGTISSDADGNGIYFDTGSTAEAVNINALGGLGLGVYEATLSVSENIVATGNTDKGIYIGYSDVTVLGVVTGYGKGGYGVHIFRSSELTAQDVVGEGTSSGIYLYVDSVVNATTVTGMATGSISHGIESYECSINAELVTGTGGEAGIWKQYRSGDWNVSKIVGIGGMYGIVATNYTTLTADEIEAKGDEYALLVVGSSSVTATDMYYCKAYSLDAGYIYQSGSSSYKTAGTAITGNMHCMNGCACACETDSTCSEEMPLCVDSVCTICPAETPYWNGTTCKVCPTETPYLNAETAQCEICPMGQVWNTDGDTCVVETCLSSMVNAGYATTAYVVEGDTITYTGNMTVATDLDISECNLNVAGVLTINSGKTLTVNNVTATSTNNHGIYLNSGILNASGDVSGSTTTTSTSSYYGIYVKGTGTLSAENVTASCVTKTGLNIDAAGGSVNARGDITSTGKTYGLTTVGTVTAQNITATGTSYAGIYVNGASAKITATGNISGTSTSSYGVYAYNGGIIETGGNVIGESTSNHGIYMSDSTSSIQGSTVTGSSETASGIYINTATNVMGASSRIEGTGGMYGIYTKGDIVSEGSINGTGNTYGINVVGTNRIAAIGSIKATGGTHGLYVTAGGSVETVTGSVTGTGSTYGVFVKTSAGKISSTNVYYCETYSNAGTINVTPKCASGCHCDCSTDETVCTGNTQYCLQGVCLECSDDTQIWNEEEGQCVSCPDGQVFDFDYNACIVDTCRSKLADAGYATTAYVVKGDTITYTGNMTVATDLDISECNLNVAGVLTVNSGKTLTVNNVTATSTNNHGIYLNSGILNASGDVSGSTTTTSTSSYYGIYVKGTGTLSAENVTASCVTKTGLNIDAAGGSVNARGDITSTGKTYGLTTVGTVTAQNITATGTSYAGIYVNGASAKITATGNISGTSTSSYGVYAYNGGIIETGGNVIGESTSNHGIYMSDSTSSIQGSTVTGSSETASGIYINTATNVMGASSRIEGTGGMYGIYTKGDIVSEGSINGTGNTYGINVVGTNRIAAIGSIKATGGTHGLYVTAGGSVETVTGSVTGTGSTYGVFVKTSAGKISSTNVYYCETYSNAGTINVTPKCASGCHCDCSTDETVCTGNTQYCLQGVCLECSDDTQIWNEEEGQCVSCPDGQVFDFDYNACIVDTCRSKLADAGYATTAYVVKGDTITYTGNMTVATDLDISECNLNVAGVLTVNSGKTLTVNNVTATSTNNHGIYLNSGILNASGDVSGSTTYTGTSSYWGVYVKGTGLLNATNLTVSSVKTAGLNIDATGGSVNARGDITVTGGTYGISTLGAVTAQNITATGTSTAGIYVNGASAKITATGNITGTSTSSYGVYAYNGGIIETGGNVIGKSTSNHGIYTTGGASSIQGSTITGISETASGIYINTATNSLTATQDVIANGAVYGIYSIGAVNGINIIGTGGTNAGVYMGGTSGKLTAKGNVTGTSTSLYGIYIYNGAILTAESDIIGTSINSHGIYLSNSTAQLTAKGTVSGTSATTSGIYVNTATNTLTGTIGVIGKGLINGIYAVGNIVSEGKVEGTGDTYGIHVYASNKITANEVIGNGGTHGLYITAAGTIESTGSVTGTGSEYGVFVKAATGTITSENVYYCKTYSNAGTISVMPKCASGCSCACESQTSVCSGDTPLCRHGTCEPCQSDRPYWNGTECTVCPMETPVWNETTKHCETCPIGTMWNITSRICEQCSSQNGLAWDGTTCVAVEEACTTQMREVGFSSDNYTVDDNTITYTGQMTVNKDLYIPACNLKVVGTLKVENGAKLTVNDVDVTESTFEKAIHIENGALHALGSVSAYARNDSAIYVYTNGSLIAQKNIQGTSEGSGYGVYVYQGNITAQQNLIGSAISNSGVFVSRGTLTVRGNVTATGSSGLYVRSSAVSNVYGNIYASAGSSYGVMVYEAAKLQVNGNVTGVSTGSYGVYVNEGRLDVNNLLSGISGSSYGVYGIISTGNTTIKAADIKGVGSVTGIYADSYGSGKNLDIIAINGISGYGGLYGINVDGFTASFDGTVVLTAPNIYYCTSYMNESENTKINGTLQCAPDCDCSVKNICIGKTPYLNMETGECEACPTETPVWNETLMQCEACPIETPVWDAEQGKCTQCETETPYYNTDTGLCESCTGNTPYYNEDTKVCERCPIDMPVWNTVTLQCEACPEKMPVWNGTTCVTEKDFCTTAMTEAGFGTDKFAVLKNEIIYAGNMSVFYDLDLSACHLKVNGTLTVKEDKVLKANTVTVSSEAEYGIRIQEGASLITKGDVSAVAKEYGVYVGTGNLTVGGTLTGESKERTAVYFKTGSTIVIDSDLIGTNTSLGEENGYGISSGSGVFVTIKGNVRGQGYMGVSVSGNWIIEGTLTAIGDYAQGLDVYGNLWIAGNSEITNPGSGWATAGINDTGRVVSLSNFVSTGAYMAVSNTGYINVAGELIGISTGLSDGTSFGLHNSGTVIAGVIKAKAPTSSYAHSISNFLEKSFIKAKTKIYYCGSGIDNDGTISPTPVKNCNW